MIGSRAWIRRAAVIQVMKLLQLLLACAQCALAQLPSTTFTRNRKPPPPPITNVSSVHLVYMTHLDLGYTGTTRAVCSKYFDKDFPAAFNTSQELRRRGGKERFRWTEFPWLIQEYLDGAANCAHGGNRSLENISAMENAIRNNDIIWHASAVNFFPEVLDEDMWSYTLGIRDALNKKYGKSWGRIVGKHSDVTGRA